MFLESYALLPGVLGYPEMLNDFMTPIGFNGRALKG